MIPPSNGITAPVRYEPAREDRNCVKPGSVVGTADPPQRNHLLDGLAPLLVRRA